MVPVSARSFLRPWSAALPVALSAIAAGALAAATPASAQRTGTRPVTDEDLVWGMTQSREFLDLGQLIARAERASGGRYLGVEPDVGRAVARIKVMRPGGQVVWVDMDMRAGRVLGMRQ